MNNKSGSDVKGKCVIWTGYTNARGYGLICSGNKRIWAHRAIKIIDLEQTISGYKAQVAGQAKYIECLLAEIRELNERIQEFVK